MRVARLIDAIGAVESNNDDEAVGDSGRSRGRYQISRAYWIDGGGRADEYTHRIRNPPDCRAIILGYWRRHAPAALASGDLETLARVHNGGPNGHRKRCTEKYWRRIRQRMAQNASLAVELVRRSPF